jgi:transcriptional regulator with XRE-family HTH domain
MTQDEPLDAVIRARIRGLRVARGWSLDALAGRCHMSASTLSRIETGHRRISIDQLVPIARALGSSSRSTMTTWSSGPVATEDTGS